MNARLFLYYLKNGVWKMQESHNIVNSVIFDERLDEQLDTGTIQTKELSGNEEKYQDFQACNLIIEEELNSTEKPNISKYFRCFSSSQKRGKNYYLCTHELVEPTRVLMGVIIDGKKVTQPTDDSPKKTLQEVVEELLDTYKLLKVDELSQFIVEKSDLLNRDSPEFHWECGTLLWECLLDIGNVINCIPKLTSDPNGGGAIPNNAKLNYLIFEKINDIKGVYEL